MVTYCIGSLVTCLTKALHPWLLSLAGQPDLGRLLVVPNLFHLRMLEAAVLLGTFSAAEMFLYSSPVLSWHNPVSQVYRQFPGPHVSVFTLTCTVNCGTLYRLVWAFPDYVQWIQLSTVGPRSMVLEMLVQLVWSRMHQSSIASVITRVWILGGLFIFNQFTTHSKTLFVLCHWSIVWGLVKNITECGKLERVWKRSVCTVPLTDSNEVTMFVPVPVNCVN